MNSGFLKTSPRDNPQGNYGMLDVVAALHWLRSNAPAFGGDPGRLTLIGIGYGAALVNLLMLSPVAKGMPALKIETVLRDRYEWSIQCCGLYIKSL